VPRANPSEADRRLPDFSDGNRERRKTADLRDFPSVGVARIELATCWDVTAAGAGVLNWNAKASPLGPPQLHFGRLAEATGHAIILACGK
jgi:hypothetical protein